MLVSAHQCSSALISAHQRSSVLISGHRGSSVLISGHRRSSVLISGHRRAGTYSASASLRSPFSLCSVARELIALRVLGWRGPCLSRRPISSTSFTKVPTRRVTGLVARSAAGTLAKRVRPRRTSSIRSSSTSCELTAARPLPRPYPARMASLRTYRASRGSVQCADHKSTVPKASSSRRT